MDCDKYHDQHHHQPPATAFNTYFNSTSFSLWARLSEAGQPEPDINTANMPSTYLIRGFRWHRSAIRYHIMMADLDDCSPDWIIGWKTSEFLLKSLSKTYECIPRPLTEDQIKEQTAGIQTRLPPEKDFVLRNQWSPIKLLEAYDDKDTTRHCLEYAFVADHVLRVELDVAVQEVMEGFESGKRRQEHAWFETLQAAMQPDEKIKWYIVVVADEVRGYYPQSVEPKGETEYIQEGLQMEAEREAQEQAEREAQEQDQQGESSRS